MNQSIITRFFSAVVVIILGFYTSSEVSAQATLDSSVVDKSLIGNRAFTSLNIVKLDRKLDTLVQRTDSLRLDTDSLYSQFVVLDNPMDMNTQSLTNVNIDSGTFDGSTVTASGAVTGGSLTDGTATLSSGALSGVTAISAASVTATGAVTAATGAFSSTISAATGSTVGTLTLADGSITDSSGAISFGNENLSTTGTLNVDGDVTIESPVSIEMGVIGGYDNGAYIGLLSSDVHADAEYITIDPEDDQMIYIDGYYDLILTVDNEVGIEMSYEDEEMFLYADDFYFEDGDVWMEDDLDVSGTLNVDGVSTLGFFTGLTVSAAGIVNVNNTTDATNGTDGSLQTDGGLSVAKSAYVGATLDVTGAGTFSSTVSAATGSTVGNLTLANGSITDSSGAISFGDENLSTTGTVTGGSLTDGTATLTGGVMSGITGITLTGADLDSDDLTLSTVGSDGDIVLYSDDEIHMYADADIELYADDDVWIYSDMDASGSGGVFIYNWATASDMKLWSASNLELDGDAQVDINSSAGAINIGNDAVAQAINIGTGAAARLITVGNAASTSVNIDALAVTIQSVNALSLTDGAANLAYDGSGNVTFTSVAYDHIATGAISIDVVDNTASAYSIGSTGKTDILKVVSTDAAEGVSMSGTLGVLGLSSLRGIENAHNGISNTGVITEVTSVASATGSATALPITASGLLTLTGAGVNVQGNAGEVDVTTTGAVDVNGAAITVDASAGISLDAAAASNLTTSVGALTLDGAAGLNIGTNADQPIDMDASTLDIDASGAITIDATSTTFVGNVVAPVVSSLAPYHKSMHIVKALTGVNYQSETANATASTQSFQLQIKDDAGSLLDGLQTVYSQTASLDLTSFATFNETAGDARGFILNVRDAGYYHLECQIHFASDVDQHVEVEVYRSYDSASSGTGSVVNTKVAYGSGMVYNSYNQVGGTINCSAIVENSIAGGDFYITINMDGANGTLDVEEFDLAISRIGEY